ncbi:MAG TPA: zinc-binding alcohol dehydrogenase family protein, partial [Frateuria sp.]|uniref:zinc-binding alcohol dehydrogenase family protein n=1 Tax=Frateuria sp. TaxID=2211372 RepID=UPI002D80C2A3
MRAVGYTDNLPIDDPCALVDFDAPTPEPGPRDLLVRPRAVSVNPVDVKFRRGRPAPAGAPTILGWDACGEVVGVGSEVTGFALGDQVWYSAQMDRPGTNAELHCVDARIAAAKPKTLDHAAAAAMPLTSVTAWECLFDRLGYTPEPSESNAARPLLVINGAGGLGSMVLQLARRAGIDVTATAGREESRRWCRDMGASKVMPHAALPQVPDNSFPRILCAHDTDRYFDSMTRLVAPQGLVCAVASTHQPHDLQPLMAKSAG